MGFLVPAFLAGLAFAAVPIVLHFIFRRRSPQVYFAATRFLKAAVRRTAKRRRFDHLLLLVLRTLLLALLALGLAAPVVRHAIAGGRSGADVVMIVDNSLSMSATEDAVARFTKAKEGVEAALARLSGADLVAIVPTVPAGAAEPGFARDADVRTTLARMEVSRERATLAGALDRAAALLAASGASAKLVYVFTDCQANAFPPKERLADRTRAGLLGVPVIVYNCARGRGRNLSIESVDVRTQGAVRGTPVEVTARVRSASPEEETVAVSLTIGAERVQRRSVTLAPGASADVALTTVAREAGVLDGFVEVETSDNLAADNRRHFSLVVRDRIKALILERERAPQPFDDDAFFLERALDPFRAEASAAQSPFEVTVATYAESPDVASYDVAYVLLRKGLDAGTAGRLSAFAAAGGTVFVFPCDDAAPGELGAWPPAQLVTMRAADRSRGEAFAVSTLDVESAELAAFADEPEALYNTVRVYDYWVADAAGKGARVLGRFEGGDPALVVGEAPARTVLFTTAPVQGMGTLAASQLFLPLVYELTYHMLAVSAGGGEVTAGETVRLAAPGQAGEGLVVTGPDGASLLVKADGAQPATFDGTRLLGTYRVRAAGADADRAAFSVNADPAESDLVPLSGAEARARAPGTPVLAADSPRSLDAALASLEPALALGDILLYAVLAVALLECMTANRRPGGATKKA